MGKVNIGLIGAGRIGRLHAQHLAFRIPDANLLAVADLFVEGAEKCAADCRIPSAFKDYRRILDNSDIDAVVICTSTDTHAQIIEEAAAAGKHIFCEKPLDLGLARIDRVLAAEEETARQAAVDNVRGSIDQAYFLGARLLALLDGPGSYPGEERKAAAIDQLVRSLSELCAYAEEKGTDYLLTISLENFDQSVDKRSLIGPTKDAAEVAARVKEEHTNFGLTVDLSHLPLLDETPQEALAAAKDHLVHIHVGNCLMKDVNHPVYGDNHPPLGIEGGENDVQELVEFLEALFDIRYFTKELPTGRPVVTFEVKPLPDQDPAVVIAATKRVWREAWARLEVG